MIVPFTTNVFFLNLKQKSFTLCPGVVVEIFKYTSTAKKKNMLPFLDILLSVLLRFTNSDNLFGILKLFVIDYHASSYIVTVVIQGSNINY